MCTKDATALSDLRLLGLCIYSVCVFDKTFVQYIADLVLYMYAPCQLVKQHFCNVVQCGWKGGNQLLCRGERQKREACQYSAHVTVMKMIPQLLVSRNKLIITGLWSKNNKQPLGIKVVHHAVLIRSFSLLVVPSLELESTRASNNTLCFVV